jgi:hypothetical protein
MHHVQLRDGGSHYPRGSLQLGHIQHLEAMFTLRHRKSLIDTGHPHLAVGQHGLSAHDDQQGHHHQDDGQVLDQATAGPIPTP